MITVYRRCIVLLSACRSVGVEQAKVAHGCDNSCSCFYGVRFGVTCGIRYGTIACFDFVVQYRAWISCNKLLLATFEEDQIQMLMLAAFLTK